METSAGSVGSTPEVKDSDPSKDLGQGKDIGLVPLLIGSPFGLVPPSIGSPFD